MPGLAWKARVDSISSDGDKILVVVSYWLSTDTNFTNKLHTEGFAWEKETDQATMVQQIKNAGASARAVYDQRDVLLPQQGAIIQVP